MNIAEKALQLKQDFDEVYEAGKQAEYNDFWDTYLDNIVDNDNYDNAFSGRGWNDETFKPTRNISPTTSAYMMFRSTGITDLVSALNNCGVALDFSNFNGAFQYTFATSPLTRIGIIDARKGQDAGFISTFNGSGNLKTIDKIILKSSQQFNAAFNNCHSLENLTIEGEIGQNGLDLHWSTLLSKASITSVINALSSTATGKTVTFSETAKNNAFTDAEWSALIATKPNWNIALG